VDWAAAVAVKKKTVGSISTFSDSSTLSNETDEKLAARSWSRTGDRDSR
jgi:hypothetical protein